MATKQVPFIEGQEDLFEFTPEVAEAEAIQPQVVEAAPRIGEAQLPTSYEELGSVSLAARNANLWKALNQLATNSRQDGLQTAQFNEEILHSLQDEMGVAKLTTHNRNINRAKGEDNTEGPRDRRVRELFSVGTGYETVDPTDRQIHKTPEQELGNRALSKFIREFGGPQGAKERNLFRKKLEKQAKARNFKSQKGN